MLWKSKPQEIKSQISMTLMRRWAVQLKDLRRKLPSILTKAMILYTYLFQLKVTFDRAYFTFHEIKYLKKIKIIENLKFNVYSFIKQSILSNTKVTDWNEDHCKIFDCVFFLACCCLNSIVNRLYIIIHL